MGFKLLTSAILTSAVLYQLSYQANWEMIFHIFTSNN